LQQAEPQIAEQARALIEAAKVEADAQLTQELARLKALKEVNPNIRDDELESVDSNRKQVLANLNDASWRLDAIRLVVVSHQ
jgi:ATP-dependent helicase HepA